MAQIYVIPIIILHCISMKADEFLMLDLNVYRLHDGTSFVCIRKKIYSPEMEAMTDEIDFVFSVQYEISPHHCDFLNVLHHI